MSKFIIECPSCGKFAEGKTGFFASKKINCVCGNIINIKTDKLTSRVCEHCGNNVVFDQTKGDKALCPVCREPVNLYTDRTKVEEISCIQCGVQLFVQKGIEKYICPVCDCENNVAERVMSKKIKRDDLASIVKYEGDADTLVWKHPVEDFNYGSQLIVHESQEAIFFKNGQAFDTFGAGRYTLETQQLPLLERLYPLPTDTESTFHSEIYYINLATVMAVKWGTDSKVRLFDSASGLHIEIGASGEFNIHVVNSRKLLTKLVGTTSNLNQSQLIGTDGKGYFRAMIMAQVKSYLAQAIKESNINILEIDERIIELSNALREKLNVYLLDYGLEITEFFISRVLTPDDDPNFRKMKEQYAEQYLFVRQEQIRKSEAEAAQQRKAVEAQTAAQMKIIEAQGEAQALRLKAQAEADAYKMQAEAEATEMKMKGYSYQQETARQVGMEAMKNGLTGGTQNMGGSVFGDIASLGIGLGAMGGMVNMTKDAMSPVMGSLLQTGQNVSNTMQQSWDCACGNKGIVGNFCSMCGSKKTKSEMQDTWDCTCGNRGIIGNFCNMCGLKRPEQTAQNVWDCTCGNKAIIGNFCSNCGRKRGE